MVLLPAHLVALRDARVLLLVDLHVALHHIQGRDGRVRRAARNGTTDKACTEVLCDKWSSLWKINSTTVF